MRSRWKGVPSLLGDLGLRLAATGLALFVVILSRPGSRREEIIPVPLRLSGIPDSLIAATTIPRTVDVRFRGSAGSLVRLRLNPPEIRLDLSDLDPGRILEREVRPADVRLPARAGASVMAIVAPRFVSVGVDRPAERSVPVVPTWTGIPAPGWTIVAEPQVEPREVRLRGPASLLAPVEFIRTVPIDLTREQSVRSIEVGVEPPPSPVSVVPGRVDIRLALDPISEEVFRDIPVQLVTNRLVSRGLLSPSRVALTLRGPRSVLALVRPSSLVPRVDARNLLSGKHFLLVNVDLPGPEFRVVGIDPDHVAVTLD